MRRKRFGAASIGALIGWGIAGLDGGFAGTVEVPVTRIDFAAAGMQTSSELGTLGFDISRSGRLVRQSISTPNGRIEMIFDRRAARVTVIDDGKVSVIPIGSDSIGLIDPFSRAEERADAPLQIVRAGIGNHLGIPCEQFRATGTENGKPLRASACITSDGIPLVTALLSVDRMVRTEITDIDFNPPGIDVQAEPNNPADASLTNG